MRKDVSYIARQMETVVASHSTVMSAVGESRERDEQMIREIMVEVVPDYSEEIRQLQSAFTCAVAAVHEVSDMTQ
eukprot:7452711-Pyramimonas_sp.AAC.1